MNMHLAFVTDGKPYQALGICVVLRGLEESFKAIGVSPKIWVVSPKGWDGQWVPALKRLYRNSQIQTVLAELRSDDRYFVQIGLHKVFSSIEPDQDVLCLDYDHVILGPLMWPLLNALNDSVLVSSESRCIEQVNVSVARMFKGDVARQSLNTSLIYGKAKLLRRIGQNWSESYKDIRPYVSRRYLVEYSFGLAAVRAGVLAEQCSSAVQSSFAVPCKRASTFHYGGDSFDSLRLKQLLEDRICSIEPSQVERSLIEATELELRNIVSHTLSAAERYVA